MVKKQSFLIILGILVIVAVATSNCLNKQVVYTCEDGTKVFDENGCPMMDIPVEREAVQESQEPVVQESEVELIEEPEEQPAPVMIPEEQEEVLEEGEPMEVIEAVEGFTFEVKDISFTKRSLNSVSYFAQNDMIEEIDPFVVIYSVDIETQEAEFLDNFKLGALRAGQSREKEEKMSVYLTQREDQLLLFKVQYTDLQKGKVIIANVTYMMNYEEMFGE